MAEPSLRLISAYFAEPNLPEQFIATQGLPFGEKYVYDIFQQGINEFPETVCADSSQLVARVKEKEGNTFRITEYYFIKTEGTWVPDGDPNYKIVSEWSYEEEGGGSGDYPTFTIDDEKEEITCDKTYDECATMCQNGTSTGSWFALVVLDGIKILGTMQYDGTITVDGGENIVFYYLSDGTITTKQPK